jgi:hypothetical protein
LQLIEINELINFGSFHALSSVHSEMSL